MSVSVNAENLSFLDTANAVSIDKEQSVQSKVAIGSHFLIVTEAESVVTFPQPERVPFSFDDVTSKSNGLRIRSQRLFLNQVSKSQSYDLIFLDNSFSKDIIYPFHSFW